MNDTIIFRGQYYKHEHSTNFNKIILFLFIDNFDQFTIFLLVNMYTTNTIPQKKHKILPLGHNFDRNKP